MKPSTKIRTCYRGALPLLVLAHLRNGTALAELATGFGVGNAIVWRYVTETVALCRPPVPRSCAERCGTPARLGTPTPSSTAP